MPDWSAFPTVSGGGGDWSQFPDADEATVRAANQQHFLAEAVRPETEAAYDARFGNIWAGLRGMQHDLGGAFQRFTGGILPGPSADEMHALGGAYESAAEQRVRQETNYPIAARALRGTVRTLPTAGAAAAVAGPYGAFVAFGAIEGSSALQEARAAGMAEPQALAYAVTQGAIEGSVGAVFQKAGLGGLESALAGQATKQIARAGLMTGLKQAGIATLQELPEEILTEIGHRVAERVSGINKNALSYDSVTQTIADTTAQTLATMGFAEAAQVGRQAIDPKGVMQEQRRQLQRERTAMQAVEAMRQAGATVNFDAPTAYREAEKLLSNDDAVRQSIAKASRKTSPDAVAAALETPTRGNWGKARLPKLPSGEHRQRFAEKARLFLEQSHGESTGVLPERGDAGIGEVRPGPAPAGPEGAIPAEAPSTQAPEAEVPPLPGRVSPGATSPEEAAGPVPATVDSALQFARDAFGEEWTIEQPETEDEKEAAAFIQQFRTPTGEALTPHFFTSKEGVRPGLIHGPNVFIKKGRGGDALWRVVGDEVAHGVGLDLKDFADDALLQESREDYLRKSGDKYRQQLLDEPDRLDREAKAHLVANFMEDRGFRERLRREQPTLWDRIVDAVLNVVGNFSPRTKAKQAVLAELRAQRGKRGGKGGKREVTGTVEKSAGPTKQGTFAPPQGSKGDSKTAVTQPPSTSPAATITPKEPTHEEVQGQAEGEVTPQTQPTLVAPKPAGSPSTAGGGVSDTRGAGKPGTPETNAKADDLVKRKARVRVKGSGRTGTVTTRSTHDRVLVKFDDNQAEKGVPAGQLDELESGEEASHAPDSSPRQPGVADRPGQPGADAAADAGGPAQDADQAAGAPAPTSDQPLPDARTDAGVEPSGDRAGTERNDSAGAPGPGESELAGPAAADQGGKGTSAKVRQQADLNARNHVIGPEDTLAVSGAKTSLKRNIAAIELLKKLETESRLATPEEKQVLAQYTGWGGLSQAFDTYKAKYGGPEWQKQWGDAHDKLTELLTEEEWKAARDTTINAHYTSRTVIEQMWSLVERLGFTGGRVLEPGAGIGHFAGLVPNRFRNSSKFTLVEIDDLSSRLLKKLYPQADVHGVPMEEFRVAPGSVDLVIGNVPFAKEGPYDAEKRYKRDLNLHNYMIARSLDALRPGGMAVLISTHNTLDASQEQRKFLAEKGQLVGAIRLPKTAFEENAKTEVVTDILVLRRPIGEEQQGQPFGKTTEIELPGGKARINEYFVANPDMVLGKHALSGSMYGKNEYTVEPTKGKLADQISAAIDNLPAGIFGGEQATGEVVEASLGDDVREGMLRMDGGKPQMALGGKWVELKAGQSIENYPKMLFTPAGLARLKDYVGVRDSYKDLRTAMLREDATDAEIEAGQKKLSKAYDAYVKRHGHVNARKSDIFQYDPEYYRVLSLEDAKTHYDKDTDRLHVIYKKAPVFTTRTLGPRVPPVSVPTVKDGMWVSLSYRGTIDPEYIGQLTGKAAEEVSRQLAADGLAFRDPATQQLQTAEKYLSGNVRKKLAAAKLAAEDDPAMQANVDALEKIQPPPVPITKVSVRLGANWIPPEVITHFGQQLFNDRNVRAYYDLNNDRWEVSVPHGNTAATSEWQATGEQQTWTGGDLLQDALNLKSPVLKINMGTRDNPQWVVDEKGTQTAKALMGKMQLEFRKLIDSNERVAALLEERYNATFNSYVDPHYDGSHLELPGASPEIKLRPYQKAAIWRILQDGYALLAHAVGAGKTYTMIGAAMEQRRLGLAKRPMIVVQNATLGQFATSFMRMYPNANVLVASKDDLSVDNRQLFLSRITSGDWDAVVMAQSTFDRLNLNPQLEAQFIQDQLDEMEEAIHEAEDAGEKRTVKDLVKARKKLEARMQKMLHSLLEAGAKNRLYFDQIGVDSLFLDEAHAYKKPFFVTKLDNLVGLNKQTSNRGMATMMKVQHVQGQNKGRNVVLATGTPITNTLGEAWHMMRFVAPQLNEDYGVTTFDGFVGAFAVKDVVREMNAGGQWVFKDALVKFTNGPELLHYLRSAWDIVSPDDLRAYFDSSSQNLPKLKGDKVQAVTVPLTAGVQNVMDFIKGVYDEFKKLSGEEKRTFSWIPAVAYGAAKAAALDIRLVSPNAKEEPGSKIEQAADRIHEEFVASGENLGTQLVFSDTFNPRNMSSLYSFMDGKRPQVEQATVDDKKEEAEADRAEAFLFHDLKKKLIARGIPAEKIALVVEANTDAKREALFSRVQAGDIRVLMGSTSRMGVGVNVQNKLVALHHMDAPWLPADYEQREGRIIRFGNENRYVSIYRYAMAKTLDGAIFSKTVRKAKFIWQVMAGKLEGREFDDPASEATMSMEEQLAAIEDDPLFFEKLELDRVKRELDLEREGFADTTARAKQRAKEAKAESERYQRETIPMQKDRIAEYKKIDLEKPKLALEGKTYTEPKAIDAAIDDLVKRRETDSRRATDAGEREPYAPTHHEGRKPITTTDEYLQHMTLNGMHVQMRTGTYTKHPQAWDKGKKKETITETLFNIYLPSGGTNLYDGLAKTGMGLFHAIKDIGHRLDAGLKRMEEYSAERAAESQELEKVGGRTWDKQAELDKINDRLQEIDAALVARGQKKDAKPGEDTHAAAPDEDFAFPDADVEEQLVGSRGLSRPGFFAKLKDGMRRMYHLATRSQEHLPNDPKFASAQEFFRLIKELPASSVDRANRLLGSALATLQTDKDLELFERKLLAENAIASHERGEGLRFGSKSIEQWHQYRDKLDRAIANRPKVQAALEARGNMVRDVVEELIRWKLLPEAAIERAGTYFHQQVLMHMELQRLGGPVATPRRVKHSYRKARVEGKDLASPKYNYNTSYLEAEMAWLAKALADVAKEQRLKTLADAYDRRKAFAKQADTRNFENLVGGPDVVAEILLLRQAVREMDSGEEKTELLNRLKSLDPTWDMRRRIALASSKLRRMDAIDVSAIDLEVADEDSQWFAQVAEIAKDENHEGNVWAKTLLKAISERRELYKTLGTKYATWETILHENDDYDVWQPEEGNYFYPALSVVDEVAEALTKGLLDKAEISKDDLRTVMALGGKRRQFVIPTELAAELEKAGKPATRHWLQEGLERWTAGLKKWLILRPDNYVAYNVRNLLGDTDAVLGGMAAGVLKHAASPKVWNDLRAYYRGESKLAAEIEQARDLGVLDSGVSAQEIPDFEQSQLFQRFYGIKDWGARVRYFAQMLDKPVKWARFRESLLRYAAYLHYQEKLASGTLTHAGGTRLDWVKRLEQHYGRDVAAAHLARNLLGDYGNLTVLGDWLKRTLIPFHSFTEINLKRYPRYAINALEYAQLKSKGKAGAKAAYLAAAVGSMAALTAAAHLWNLLMFGDDEDDLSLADRSAPHIILGKRGDGTIRILRNTSALGEFTEVLGLNQLLSLWPKYRDGQISTGDLVKETAMGPVNTLAQGIRPDVKLPVELALGASLYPDVRRPRSQARDELIAESVALADPYRAIKGTVMQDGSRARKGYLERLGTGGLSATVDPRKNALGEIHDARNNFKRSKGLPTDTIWKVSKYKRLRDAAEAEDYESFRDARRRFIDDGGTFEGYVASLRMIDPVESRLSNDLEREFTGEFLTDLQRDKLRVARDYADELSTRMLGWWYDAAKDDTPQQRRALYAQTNKVRQRLQDRLRWKFQNKRQQGESAAEFIKRRRDWMDERRSAAERLKRLNMALSS